MDALPPIKKKWDLTIKAFNKLLASLHPDSDCAAERYEIIRQKLLTFFENRGCLTAEELADDTLNRVAKRLDDGATIYAANPDSYFYGIARNVLKEYWDSPQPSELSPSDEPYLDPCEEEAIINKREQEGLRLECQKQCIDGLAREMREIVIKYYGEEPSVKMKKKREELAAQLRMTPNALRIKACRIRDKLDKCVMDCLKW